MLNVYEKCLADRSLPTPALERGFRLRQKERKILV